MNSIQKIASDDVSWTCQTCGALNSTKRFTCGKCDPKKDPIVQMVKSYYEDRSRIGIEKYGTTLHQNKASILEWLTHLQEELMDATLYIEKLRQEQIKKMDVNES